MSDEYFIVVYRSEKKEGRRLMVEIGYITAPTMRGACKKVSCEFVDEGIMRLIPPQKNLCDFYLWRGNKARAENLSRESWGEITWGPALRELLAVTDLP